MFIIVKWVNEVINGDVVARLNNEPLILSAASFEAAKKTAEELLPPPQKGYIYSWTLVKVYQVKDNGELEEVLFLEQGVEK